MTILLNTITDKFIAELLEKRLSGKEEVKVFNTANMKISHCLGCTHCFLKTPGICAIKDDYEQILKSLAHSKDLWLVADTSFGFMNANGKKVMDRILPMLNMGLEFRDGEMRHTLRYGALNVGLIYRGKGDQQLLDFWCKRASMNLGGHSLGAYSIETLEKETLCIQ